MAVYSVFSLFYALIELCLNGHSLEFQNYSELLSLMSTFILANSADPDEMQKYVATHFGLLCLSMNLFTPL